MKFSHQQIESLCEHFRDREPQEVIAWSLDLGKKPVLTTNFRPYEAAILHAVTRVAPDIPVIWCDTGYNTPHTYRHAQELIRQLGLNIFLYVPRQTTAWRDTVMGVPGINDPGHAEFTEQVKLEPFRRAMAEHRPGLWLTNLRKGQTAHRDTLDVLSLSEGGTLKVSPFFHWSDRELDTYLEAHDLPNEHRYFDPTKVLADRECGLHT